MIVHYRVKTALIITEQQDEAEKLEGLFATAGVEVRTLWGACATGRKVAQYLRSGEYDALILSPRHATPSGSGFILPSHERVQVDRLLKDLTRPPVFVSLLACDTSDMGDRFYKYGTRLVLATRSDKALARSYIPLVSTFLEGVFGGMTAGQALRAAQDRLQHDDPQNYSFQLFTLIGNPDSRMKVLPDQEEQRASQGDHDAEAGSAQNFKGHVYRRDVLFNLTSLYSIVFSAAAYERLTAMAQVVPVAPMPEFEDSAVPAAVQDRHNDMLKSVADVVPDPRSFSHDVGDDTRETDVVETQPFEEPATHIFQVIPPIQPEGIEIGDIVPHHDLEDQEHSKQIEVAFEHPVTILDDLHRVMSEREQLLRWWHFVRRSGWGSAEWRPLA
ncbi:MAG: hypothetical protein U0822_10085 [Anaerolineae bacterium]